MNLLLVCSGLLFYQKIKKNTIDEKRGMANFTLKRALTSRKRTLDSGTGLSVRCCILSETLMFSTMTHDLFCLQVSGAFSTNGQVRLSKFYIIAKDGKIANLFYSV
jgi:hypothetical protein